MTKEMQLLYENIKQSIMCRIIQKQENVKLNIQ